MEWGGSYHCTKTMNPFQMLGKEEKAMFRAHSDACLAVSRVQPRLLDALLAGQLLDAAPLRRHVYCVLLKCKLISKDGKLQKAAVLGKMAARPDAKNATKVSWNVTAAIFQHFVQFVLQTMHWTRE